eukprot:CAMPEP_0113475688 /NCGR_PEP_ID=MMETSP0014_2-20120614/19253_1 /TAXON_ID=2857 /ORGANISM="Nitzschia sp." /LENGTH=476 /DNA_ID=CAMNT_0000368623 /DNA_START=1094 /DNA_END=2524 /DNA_ORIENTATION=- /assembly_acc=CAM_ASM_000159
MTKHKKKDKKRKHRDEEEDDDDNEDRKGRTKTKKKSKKKSVVEQQQPQVAAAYVEDITGGMEAIKRKKPTAKFSHSSSKTWSIGGSGVAAATSSSTKASICKLRVDNAEENRRLQRMQRFGNVATSNDDDDAEQRLFKALSSSRERGQQSASLGSGTKVRKIPLDGNENNVEPLVGKSESIEKSYLRLTSDPKPEDVRPLPVLRKALLHIRTQYVEQEDVEWANDQLKAVRQDLTVQHIRDPFVLDVYETHARLLLEHGDLNEFNQCQTMIRSLTNPMLQQQDQDQDQNFTRRKHRDKRKDMPLLQQSEQSRDEFAAYGILYSLVQRSAGDIIITLSYFTTLSRHSQQQQNGRHSTANLSDSVTGPAFRHAVQVVKAVIHNDYHTFFRLYECAPHMSAYLMDFLLRRIRQNAYESIVASYRPSVGVEQFRETLVFSDMDETRRFLRKSGAVWVEDQGGSGPPAWVDCKASFLALPK